MIILYVVALVILFRIVNKILEVQVDKGYSKELEEIRSKRHKSNSAYSSEDPGSPYFDPTDPQF